MGGAKSGLKRNPAPGLILDTEKYQWERNDIAEMDATTKSWAWSSPSGVGGNNEHRYPRVASSVASSDCDDKNPPGGCDKKHPNPQPFPTMVSTADMEKYKVMEEQRDWYYWCDETDEPKGPYKSETLYEWYKNND